MQVDICYKKGKQNLMIRRTMEIYKISYDQQKQRVQRQIVERLHYFLSVILSCIWKQVQTIMDQTCSSVGKELI